jgi:hypothetical protein
VFVKSAVSYRDPQGAQHSDRLWGPSGSQLLAGTMVLTSHNHLVVRLRMRGATRHVTLWVIHVLLVDHLTMKT